MGVSYSPDMLDDPDYNMRLGSTYLGEMVDNFCGSYVMAAAAYNAGPGRPAQWAAVLRRPARPAARSGRLHRVHPVLRDPQLRDAGDGEDAGLPRPPERRTAPLTLSSDLKRGGYVYRPSTVYTPSQTTAAVNAGSPGTMAPIPDQ